MFRISMFVLSLLLIFSHPSQSTTKRNHLNHTNFTGKGYGWTNLPSFLIPLFSDKRKSDNQRLTKQDERDIRRALLNKISAQEWCSQKDMKTYLLVLTNFIKKKIPGQKTTPGLNKNGVFDVQCFKQDLHKFELATISKNLDTLFILSNYPEPDMEQRLMKGEFKKGNVFKMQEKIKSQNPHKGEHDQRASTRLDWESILKPSGKNPPKKFKPKFDRR